MLAEIGSFALAIALALSLLSAGSLCFPEKRFATLSHPASLLTALLIFFAFVILITLRIDSDFTVANVAEHSNYALPLLYKIAGTWGNHEGSMLLWALVVATCGAMLSKPSPHAGEGWMGGDRVQNSVRTTPHPSPLPQGERGIAAAIQSLLLVGVLTFILVTSNPFARIFPPPADGNMLNPLLQDVALAIHPPLLYVGYVGFSAVFSLAVAGLLVKKIDREWAAWSHPWIMTAWAFLTAGIALGSWWAYRELGWGGFWFWDPVENASLLPWLAGTALLHSNIVLKKRGSLAGWVALLAILTFGLSLIGTFLVRSGAITSVHSFASDPARGVFILIYIAIAVGSALWLYAARLGSLEPTAPLRPASREGMIVINNLFIMTACITVLLGTTYPLFAEVFGGGSITVGAPYYHVTFLPLMAVPLFFAGLVPFMAWKKAAMNRVMRRAFFSLMVALTCFMWVRHQLLAGLAMGLAGFLIAASAQWISQGKWRDGANWPVFFGHVGAACLIIGVAGAGIWAKQTEMRLSPGDLLIVADHEIALQTLRKYKTPNYTAIQATLAVTKHGKHVATLIPESRQYAIRDVTTTEASIYSTAFYDLYTVIGKLDDPKKVSLRIYHKPRMNFLWFGALLITVGGLLSAVIATRRHA